MIPLHRLMKRNLKEMRMVMRYVKIGIHKYTSIGSYCCLWLGS